jgi:predicted ArsR family transcriptional regulator
MIAIIARAVEDAVQITDRLKGRRRSIYAAYNPEAVKHTRRELEQLKSELRHEWFGEICKYAGIHQDIVLRHINKLEERALAKHGS